MKASTVIVLAAASVASAQLSAIPSCALTCAISSLGSTGCAQTDIACICKASGFVTALQPCVEKACSPADLQKTITAAEGLCLQAGVTLTIVTGGASSTTSSMESSSMAATTTTEAATTTTAAATTTTEAVTSSATVVIPTTVSNTTMTTSVTAGTNGTGASTTASYHTTGLPTASPTGNAATRNGVAVGGLAAVLAFAAALL